MTNQSIDVPGENEDLITDPIRVQQLMRYYLSRMTGAGLRATDRKFGWLMRDPSGWVWGVVVPESIEGGLQLPYLERYRGVLIGEDNLEVSQPLPAIASPLLDL